jgi:hypothetical protein
MYTVPAAGAWWHAVGPPLERRVRLRATPDNPSSRGLQRQALPAKGSIALGLHSGFANMNKTLVWKLTKRVEIVCRRSLKRDPVAAHRIRAA